MTTLTGCNTSAGPTGIVIYDVNTGASRLITPDPGSPVWSPTADVIAWSSEDGLFTSDLETGVTQQLAGHSAAGSPSWSPDGTQIAVVDAADQSLDVFDTGRDALILEVSVVVDDAKQEAPYLSTMGGPSWSPDGERIAFTCWDGASDELCLLELDSGEVHRLTRIGRPTATGASGATGATAGMGPAVWSPDGSLLAAAAYAEKRGAPNGVFVIDPAKGTATKVTDLTPGSTLAWNARGDSVLFAATRNGRSDVYQVPIDGEEWEALTASQPAGARNPAYSPNSDQLAFESDGQVLVTDLANRDQVIARAGPVAGGWPLSWNREGDQIAFYSAPNQVVSYP